MTTGRPTASARPRARVTCSHLARAPEPDGELRPSGPGHGGQRRDPRHPFTFESPTHAGRLAALHGVHVLLVEDNADARNIVRRVLEHCGAVVTPAESPLIALRRLRTARAHPHILVSDLALPGQDGYALLAEIRARRGLHGLPAIAITAHRNEYDREETLAAGFQEYFQKPLDLVAFCDAVARLAGRPPRGR